MDSVVDTTMDMDTTIIIGMDSRTILRLILLLEQQQQQLATTMLSTREDIIKEEEEEMDTISINIIIRIPRNSTIFISRIMRRARKDSTTWPT